jgi:tetratricopeptide (TPR) repeat protein
MPTAGPVAHFLISALFASCALLLGACTSVVPREQTFASSPLLETSIVRRANFAGAAEEVMKLERNEDWAGLVKFARAQAKREPQNVDWDVITGYGLLQLKDYRQAASVLSLVTQRSPEDIDGWNLLGEAQHLLGDLPRSARTLEYGATINRTSHATYFLLGGTYSDWGRPDLAIKAYRESLRLEPSYSPAWFGLGKVYQRTGQREELEAVIEQLKKLSPPLAEELSKSTS